MEKIQVTRSSMPLFDEYTNEIKDLWDSHWLSNSGLKHQKLEKKLKKYLKVSNISLFSSGHMALDSVINLMNIKGEIITTPYTFVSTTHAIVNNGSKPVFCDINFDDYTLDVNKIEQLITERTTAIVPVHVYGNVCNIEGIKRLAKKYNLKVIYDAAHAFGVTVNNKGIGSYGDASIFSFHATKVFNTIEGGAVTSSSQNLITELNEYKNFGISSKEEVEFVGCNAKMNEFQAAMGICNLLHIDEEIKKRKQVVKRYIENLGDIKGLKLIKENTNINSNYAYFPVLFDGFCKSRNEVYSDLLKENVMARKYFYPLTSHFQCYHNNYKNNRTPIAEYVSERILTLPLYADLQNNDVDRICKIILRQ